MYMHNEHDAHNALMADAQSRRLRDTQHAVTVAQAHKARRILEERRKAGRFVGKVALIQAAALAVIALFGRGGAA